MLAALGLSSDAAIGVESAERAIAVIEDAGALLDERLDVVDELLFIKLVTGCAISLLDVLGEWSAIVHNDVNVNSVKHTSVICFMTGWTR